MDKKIVIFIDSGDTIVDESTEIKFKSEEFVLKAELIPGAKEMLMALKEKGYKIIMVADGLRHSFMNVYTQHDIYDCFDGHIYSEDVGVHKPDSRMFDAALKAAGLTREDCYRVVMVGNNLSRDVKGANDMNMISVHMAWSHRYSKEPAEKSEIPDYVIHKPMELVELVEKIENNMKAKYA